MATKKKETAQEKVERLQKELELAKKEAQVDTQSLLKEFIERKKTLKEKAAVLARDVINAIKQYEAFYENAQEVIPTVAWSGPTYGSGNIRYRQDSKLLEKEAKNIGVTVVELRTLMEDKDLEIEITDEYDRYTDWLSSSSDC